ncbi:helix-turn-helix transcriptional regulator [Natronomonas sp. LN261]|uniref:helix-turn-helix transcriptional regulator n=1 Tax=Natronomonas sp. LN261 TaxID=2750669 RepID=UPI001C684C63|nr:helix-turn-helix transcriptional regulator [Natronomonas sp. LN261]
MNESENIHDLLGILCDDLDADVSPSSAAIDDVLSAPNAAPQMGTDETGSRPQYTETRLSEDAVSTMSGWLDNGYLQSIEKKQAIAQLDETMLLLIAIRGEASGKELRQDLNRLFGADLSPGTVYPHLIDLADDDLLKMTELAKRKVYRISETEAVLDRVSSDVNRLLTFSIVLKLLMIEYKSRDTQSHGGDE